MAPPQQAPGPDPVLVLQQSLRQLEATSAALEAQAQKFSDVAAEFENIFIEPGNASYRLFAAFDEGDAIAKVVIDEATEFWGMAAANLVSLFNPEKIIFGGGVFGPATQLIDSIALEASRWAQPVAMQSVEFEASQLGNAAALHGAAYLALKRARLIQPQLREETS